jgi:IS5 family transposase
MGHALMENRNGLVVDVETTQASGTAEREAAARMVARTLAPGSTLGADKSYDTADFVRLMRKAKVTPHVAAKKSGSAIDARTRRHAGYALSMKRRKRVEEIFGWAKTIGGLRKTRFIGLTKVKVQTIFTLACYNLTRMATLFGWPLSAV